MSRLTELIARTKANDPQLGADLEKEFKTLSGRHLPFGLNFERHSREAVELPLRPIRKGDKVLCCRHEAQLPRGTNVCGKLRPYTRPEKTADLELLGTAEPNRQTVALADLVVVAEFRDTIYPGLISTGKVQQWTQTPSHCHQ